MTRKRFVLLEGGPRGLYAHEWVPRHATDGKLVTDGSRAGDGARSPPSPITSYRHADGPVTEWLVWPWVRSSTRPMSRDRSPSGMFVHGCHPDGHGVAACHWYDTWPDTNKAAVGSIATIYALSPRAYAVWILRTDLQHSGPSSRSLARLSTKQS